MKKPRHPTPEERYAGWVRYIEAAFRDITHGFWNRKMFRSVQTMFVNNPELRCQSGSLVVRSWFTEIYAHYAIMLVGRELDTQAGVLNLMRLLHEVEKHQDVLLAHAKGLPPFPTSGEVAEDRRRVEAEAATVVDHRNRFIGHRTPSELPALTFDDIDRGLRAVRDVLRKYRGVLIGIDLLSATPVPQYDWLAPFRLPWWYSGFVEPPLEEDGPMTEDEKRADAEQFKRLGFRRS